MMHRGRILYTTPNGKGTCSRCGAEQDKKTKLYCLMCGTWLTEKPEVDKRMNIGEAIQAVKEGKKITREGWNGIGQFVYYVPPARYEACTDVGKEIAGQDGKVSYGAYLAIRTTYGVVNTWVPSISDLLAEDWRVV